MTLRYIGIMVELIVPEFLEEVQRRHGDLLVNIPSPTEGPIPGLADV